MKIANKEKVSNMKKQTNIEKTKKYIDKLFLDKSTAYARNMNMPKSEIQQILIGEMLCVSEIKRFIEYIESE